MIGEDLWSQLRLRRTTVFQTDGHELNQQMEQTEIILIMLMVKCMIQVVTQFQEWFTLMDVQ